DDGKAVEPALRRRRGRRISLGLGAPRRRAGAPRERSRGWAARDGLGRETGDAMTDTLTRPPTRLSLLGRLREKRTTPFDAVTVAIALILIAIVIVPLG